MSLIERLVEIRLDNFIKEYDIDISCFGETSMYINRKVSWDLLKQKLIKHNVIIDDCNEFDCYLVIENIIWKNIMVFNMVDNNCCTYMHHNNFQNKRLIYRNENPYLSYNILLNKNWIHYAKLKDNCSKLETKIINYMMLLDIIVMQYMSGILVDIFKIYIFDVILVL